MSTKRIKKYDTKYDTKNKKPPKMAVYKVGVTRFELETVSFCETF